MAKLLKYIMYLHFFPLFLSNYVFIYVGLLIIISSTYFYFIILAFIQLMISDYLKSLDDHFYIL